MKCRQCYSRCLACAICQDLLGLDVDEDVATTAGAGTLDDCIMRPVFEFSGTAKTNAGSAVEARSASVAGNRINEEWDWTGREPQRTPTALENLARLIARQGRHGILL